MGDQNRDPNQNFPIGFRKNRTIPTSGPIRTKTSPQRQAGHPGNPGQQRSGHDDKARRDEKGGQGGQR